MKLKDLIAPNSTEGMIGDIRVLNYDTMDEYYAGPASNVRIHVPALLEYNVENFYSTINFEFLRAYKYGDAIYSRQASYIVIQVTKEN